MWTDGTAQLNRNGGTGPRLRSAGRHEVDPLAVDDAGALCARSPPDNARDACVAVRHDPGRNHEEHQRLESEVDLALQLRRVSGGLASVRECIARTVVRLIQNHHA